MRKITIPIIIIAAIVLVGCKSVSAVHTETTAGTNAVVSTNSTAGTNSMVSTNASVSTSAPVHINTPSETMAENVMLGDIGAAFICLLPIILALKRT
jgi:uncharacterized protein YcfL